MKLKIETPTTKNNLGSLPIWFLFLASISNSPDAIACAVCGVPLDKTSDVFVASTLVLSVVPLMAIGCIVWVLVKSFKKDPE